MLVHRVLIFVSVGLVAAGCDDRTRTRKVIEPFAVEPGSPTVEKAVPEVKTDRKMATDVFGVNVPRQGDGFTQLPARQVDVAAAAVTNGASSVKCEGAGLRNIVRSTAPRCLSRSAPSRFVTTCSRRSRTAVRRRGE